MNNIPQQAIDIIREFEGCLLYPYKDTSGLVTIGIGHLVKPGENFDNGITEKEAEELLQNDLNVALNAILKYITRSLTDNQFSALLSFTYNLGGKTLQRSTLRRKCNRIEDDEVPEEFMKYVFSGGIKTAGLVRRRKAEAYLYNLRG